MTDPNRPIADARAAFGRLATSDKAAFVFEATFDTIGQAIAETGRTLSDAVSSMDFDALFRMDGRDFASPPAPPPAPTGPAGPAASAAPPAARRATAKKPAPRKKTPPNPGVPPTDDGPAAA